MGNSTPESDQTFTRETIIWLAQHNITRYCNSDHNKDHNMNNILFRVRTRAAALVCYQWAITSLTTFNDLNFQFLWGVFYPYIYYCTVHALFSKCITPRMVCAKPVIVCAIPKKFYTIPFIVS